VSDPVSRPELVREEVDRVFGAGFAVAHQELVAIVVRQRAISSLASTNKSLA